MLLKLFRNLSLILYLAIFSTLEIYAQAKGITPLHKFMQLNADTTFILEHQSGWLGPPKYLMLSKKGDTTTAYIYDTPPRANVLMPKSIRSAIHKANGYNPTQKIEVNQFFRPVPMPNEFDGKVWKMIMAERPWNISDDKVDGRGCPPKKDRSEISDGGTTNLYLITAGEIKTLSFYAPDFYEKECPGRKGRQSILKIDKLFSELFKTDK